MRIDSGRRLEHAHRFGVRRDAERSEVSCVQINIPDLGRLDKLPFGVALRNLFPGGDVPRTHPLTGDPVAGAEGEEFEARRHNRSCLRRGRRCERVEPNGP